jgi:hypothetical protein
VKFQFRRFFACRYLSALPVYLDPPAGWAGLLAGRQAPLSAVRQPGIVLDAAVQNGRNRHEGRAGLG